MGGLENMSLGSHCQYYKYQRVKNYFPPSKYFLPPHPQQTFATPPPKDFGYPTPPKNFTIPPQNSFVPTNRSPQILAPSRYTQWGRYLGGRYTGGWVYPGGRYPGRYVYAEGRYTTLPYSPVLTSSGGHQSGQYASYWNAFFFLLHMTYSVRVLGLQSKALASDQ